MTQVYFDDIDKRISVSIDSAEKRVYVAVAWFTNNSLFEALLNAAQRKVKVKVLILDDILNRNEFGLDFGVLANHGASVKFSYDAMRTMHHKFCVIDDMVITGSYNWTYYANYNNENVMISDEVGVVDSYCKQFEKIFSHGIPIILPYKHIKWTDVKEGDFSALRRNILLDVIAKDDANKEIRKKKLISLNHAYKSGDAGELAKASSLATEQHLRTITDVLTSAQKRYVGELYDKLRWDLDEEPADVRFSTIDKWIFVPTEFGESNNHEKYVRGYLHFYKWYKGRKNVYKKMRIDVYDSSFISSIEPYLLGSMVISNIPEDLLCINLAKLSVFRLPSAVRERDDDALVVFCIAKEVNEKNITYYEGWDPQSRKEKIIREYFRK